MRSDPSPKLLSRLAVLFGIFDITFSLLSYGFGLANHYDRVRLFTDPGALIGITFALVGMLVGYYRPRHMMGWIYLSIALSQGLCTFAMQYATYALVTQPGSLPFGSPMSILAQTGWMPGLELLFTYAILLFPNGSVPAPRWRFLAWLSLAPVLISCFAIAGAWPYGGRAFLEDPSRFDPPHDSLLWLAFVSYFPLLVLCGILSVIALIDRFVHSRGIERAQIKWFTFAAAFTVFGIAMVNFLNIGQWSYLLLAPLVTAIPTAAGIAILRYHLFDIDLIIRRTLLYAVVSGLLAAVYFGSVLLLQEVFRSLSGQTNSVAIVLSTLIIAALFTPLRARVQQALDRRFYRQRYDAEKALTAFSSSLRSEVDLSQVSEHLLNAVQETVQPENATLWLRKT